MSIESEILRIQRNVANCYAAVAEKGGEVPLQPTSENLAAAVASIPAGAGGGAYLVKSPVGTIVIWSGSADDIPTGWHICDGTDGTPDLRDKFVLGAGPNHSVGDAGGSEEVQLTVEQMPNHVHPVGGLAVNYVQVKNDATATIHAQIRDTSQYTNSFDAGGDKPHPNMPPYYTLCYIMKLTADETDGGSSVIEWGDINGRPDLSSVSSMRTAPIILRAMLWDESNQQIIPVNGVLADEEQQLVIAKPKRASRPVYHSCGIELADQGENFLTFECKTAPNEDVSVNVFIFGAAEVGEEYAGEFVWWSPKMTSNNTPAPYAVSGSGYMAGSEHPGFWAAFDNNEQTFWHSQDNENNYITIDLGQKTPIFGLQLVPYGPLRGYNYTQLCTKLFTLYGSDDGENFYPIFTNNPDAESEPEAYAARNYEFNRVNYRYYKIQSELNWAGANDYFCVSEIRFYRLESET